MALLLLSSTHFLTHQPVLFFSSLDYVLAGPFGFLSPFHRGFLLSHGTASHRGGSGASTERRCSSRGGAAALAQHRVGYHHTHAGVSNRTHARTHSSRVNTVSPSHALAYTRIPMCLSIYGITLHTTPTHYTTHYTLHTTHYTLHTTHAASADLLWSVSTCSHAHEARYAHLKKLTLLSRFPRHRWPLRFGLRKRFR